MLKASQTGPREPPALSFRNATLASAELSMVLIITHSWVLELQPDYINSCVSMQMHHKNVCAQ